MRWLQGCRTYKSAAPRSGRFKSARPTLARQFSSEPATKRGPMTIRFRAMLAVATALAVGSFASSAQSQAPYPSQTIKLIVPYAPGGFPDTVARVLGKRMQQRMGQSVIVENRPGANGALAANALSSSPPDGYTLV